MGRLTRRLVTRHNPNRVYALCLSYGRNDNSDVRRHVSSLCNEFIDMNDVLG